MAASVRKVGQALMVLAVLASPACHRRTTAPAPESHPLQKPLSSRGPALRGSPTDEGLRETVASALRKDAHIHAANLQVIAGNGVVVLTGTTDNPLSRERATRIAQVTRGVRSVENHIEVLPVPRPDSDIARDVRKALKNNAATARMPIFVQVRRAVVTLTGIVTSWQEQQFAERVADGVRGVRFTQNDLTTKPNTRRTTAEIRGDIESRLAWDALVEHDPITVSVEGSQVSLRGVTGSAAERIRAVDDAWVSGVLGVDASQLLVGSPPPQDAALRTQPKLDADIARAIRNALRYDPRTRAAEIVPQVAAGVVTLLGTVETLSARMTAAALARSTVGVRAVRNELVVPPLQHPLADRLLQSQIEDALAFDPLVSGQDIKLTVKGGRATLTGSVDTYFERAEALDDASGVANVVRVDDQLEVRNPAEPYVYSNWVDPFTPHVDTWYVTSLRPTLSDSEIAERIKANFKWSAFIQPDRVRFTVLNGKATLTGNVSSFRERQAAIDGALEAGAITVDDEMNVG